MQRSALLIITVLAFLQGATPGGAASAGPTDYPGQRPVLSLAVHPSDSGGIIAAGLCSYANNFFLISGEGGLLHAGRLGPLAVTDVGFACRGERVCAVTSSLPFLIQGKEAYSTEGDNWSACPQEYLYLDPGQDFHLLDRSGKPIFKIPRIRWFSASKKGDCIAVGGVEGAGVLDCRGGKILYDDDWPRWFVDRGEETGGLGIAYTPIGAHPFRLFFSDEASLLGAIRRGRLLVHDFRKKVLLLETGPGHYSHAGRTASGEILAFRREVPMQSWMRWINRFLLSFSPEPPIPGRFVRFRDGVEVARSRLHDDIAAIYYLPSGESAEKLLTTDGVSTITLREPWGKPLFSRKLDGRILSVDYDSDSGLLAACTSGHTLWLLRENGVLLWSKAFDLLLTAKLLPGGGIVGGTADGRIVKLDRTGDVDWDLLLPPGHGPEAREETGTERDRQGVPILPFWENLGEEVASFDRNALGPNLAREKGVEAMALGREEIFPRFVGDRYTNGALSDPIPEDLRQRDEKSDSRGSLLPYAVTVKLAGPREIALIAVYDGGKAGDPFVSEYRIEIHSEKEGWRTPIQVRESDRRAHFHPLKASRVDAIRYTIGLSSDGLPHCGEIEVYAPKR